MKSFKHRNPVVPIVVSILAVVGWLVFILVYALFWSTAFSLFQNIIVTIVTLAIAGALVSLMWVVWGMRFARRAWMENQTTWKSDEAPD